MSQDSTKPPSGCDPRVFTGAGPQPIDIEIARVRRRPPVLAVAHAVAQAMREPEPPPPPPPSPTVFDLGIKVGSSFLIELLQELGLVDAPKAWEALVLALNPSLARRVGEAVMLDNARQRPGAPPIEPQEREWSHLTALVKEIAGDVRTKLKARRREEAEQQADREADEEMCGEMEAREAARREKAEADAKAENERASAEGSVTR